MHGISGNILAQARETERRICQGADKIVSRKFGSVAKVLWPVKTAANIAAIAGANERTAARWLAGEFEIPAIVIAAVIIEITKRE
jgi:pyocin large subunit-like protein